MEQSTKKTILYLAAILFLGLILRTPGLFWGHNLFGDGRHYVLNPDERHHITIAEEFFKGVDYNQFYVRGLGNQIAALFGLGKVLFKSVELAPQYLYAIGRLLALLYALAGICLNYFFSYELFEDRIVALLSSLFLTLSWIQVAYSHIAVPDTSALFWMYLSFYFVLRYVKRKDDADLLMASVGAGFSIGTKPNAILLVPLLLIIIDSRRKLYHGGMVLVALLGSFALINGFSYTPQSFMNFRYMTQMDSFSGAQFNKLIHVPVYSLLLLSCMGMPVFLLAVWGLYKFTASRRLSAIHIKELLCNKYFLVTVPLVIHFYLICGLVVNFTRYLMPLVPFLAVFAAYGLVRLIGRGSQPKLFMGVLAGIIIYQLLQIGSLEQATLWDSRKLMGEWMRQNISTDQVISIGPSTNNNLVPSVYNTSSEFDAEYIVMHSNFYSRYLTGGYGFKDTYPESCKEIYHCWGGEPTRNFVQRLFRGETDYVLLKKFEMTFITPEMLLLKYLFGPRVDGYGSYTGDTVLFGKLKAG